MDAVGRARSTPGYSPRGSRPPAAPCKPAHLGGIYFWSISVGQRLDVASARTSYSFVAAPGAAAIKGCFSQLAGA